MSRENPSRSALLPVLAATLVSGGGGVALFDSVMGYVMEQQAAHIETLELALERCGSECARYDDRLERCQEARRELEAERKHGG